MSGIRAMINRVPIGRPTRRVGGTLALAAALVAIGLAMPTPASASVITDSQPQVVTWTTSGGATISVRALSAAEIRAKGLDKYIDMRRQRVTTPSVSPSAALSKSGIAPRKRPRGVVSPLASGCWSATFGYGTFSTPKLYGQTGVNWCGDGSWVTYSNSNCWGGSDWPTYNYLGCTNYPNYGAGWNLYQVETHWDLCDGWVSGPWGTCVHHSYAWERYQFLGSGSWFRTAGW